MLRLPSGHIVGIMHERVRYHAARLNLNITPYTPQRLLYPFIDVVFADAKEGPELWRKNYVFSGHTLADRGWLDQWPQRDREAFDSWLRETPQRQAFEAARRRLLADSSPIKLAHHSYPQQLFSLLAKRIGALDLNSASAGHWRNTIQNLQGIRREEVRWSGVLDFLNAVESAGRKSIPKANLLSNIRFDSIRMELVNELERDESAALNFTEKAKVYTNAQLHCAGIWVADNDIGIVRYINPSLGYRVGMIRRRRQGVSGTAPDRWFALSPYMEALPDINDGCVFYGSAEQAMAAATAHARRSGRFVPPMQPRDRYQYMSLAGGSDYREWLLTLPDFQASHFTAHYLERNVLLHMRTKVRIDAAGRRLLFIEEIQSDWHQVAAGHRRHRWSSPIPAAPFRNEWVGLAVKLLLLHAAEQGYHGLAWTDGATQQLRYGKNMAPVKRVYDDAIPDCLRKLGHRWSADVAKTYIRTKRPNLMAARHRSGWEVRDYDRKLRTRPRHTKEDAMQLIRRHSKTVDLTVSLYLLPEAMCRHLMEHGLPLFGEHFD